MADAYHIGKLLAEAGIRVIYGGASIGLMGAVANGALDAGGEVIGVLPGFLQTKEITHTRLSQLIIVDSMHQRKLKIHELSDGIIALPGGFGTMEELFEMLTWAQLGLHPKPIGLLNTAGYYHHLSSFIQSMEGEGFLSSVDAGRVLISDHAANLLEKMARFVAPPAPIWINTAST